MHNAAFSHNQNVKYKVHSTQRIRKEQKEKLCELCVYFAFSVLKIFRR